MRRLLRPFLFLAALVFLLEAWLWERLSPVVAWIVGLVFWKQIRVAVAAAIDRMPPYGTLTVFSVPVLLLLPFKFSALWLIAHGHWLFGGAVFMLAKIVGLAVTAFLFETCKPKLMQIAWFRTFFAAVLRARDWAHAIVDPYKRKIRSFARYLRRMAPLSANPGYMRRVLSRLRYRMSRAGRS